MGTVGTFCLLWAPENQPEPLREGEEGEENVETKPQATAEGRRPTGRPTGRPWVAAKRSVRAGCGLASLGGVQRGSVPCGCWHKVPQPGALKQQTFVLSSFWGQKSKAMFFEASRWILPAPSSFWCPLHPHPRLACSHSPPSPPLGPQGHFSRVFPSLPRTVTSEGVSVHV